MYNITEIDIRKDHEIYKACEDLILNNPIDKDINYIKIGDKQDLLHLVANFLKVHGHGVNQTHFTDKNATVEIHQYLDNNGSHVSPLCVHLESDGDFRDSETFVCYFKNTGKGGEFGIFSDEDVDSLVRSIDTHPQETSVKCLIFDEKMYHAPLPFSFGERLIVSIHISRNNAP